MTGELFSGEHNQGQILKTRMLSDANNELESIHFRHHQVDDHSRYLGLRQSFESLSTAAVQDGKVACSSQHLLKQLKR